MTSSTLAETPTKRLDAGLGDEKKVAAAVAKVGGILEWEECLENDGSDSGWWTIGLDIDSAGLLEAILDEQGVWQIYVDISTNRRPLTTDEARLVSTKMLLAVAVVDELNSIAQ